MKVQYRMCHKLHSNVTMLTLDLPLAVSSFSVNLRSFGLLSKARIILQYSHICSTTVFFFFLENTNANPTFPVKAIQNLSNVKVITMHLILKNLCKMFISIWFV